MESQDGTVAVDLTYNWSPRSKGDRKAEKVFRNNDLYFPNLMTRMNSQFQGDDDSKKNKYNKNFTKGHNQIAEPLS